MGRMAELEAAAKARAAEAQDAPEQENSWLPDAQTPQRLLHGAVEAIPGGEFLARKLGGALTGTSQAEMEAAAQQLESTSSGAVGVGNLAGGALMGAALPGAGAGAGLVSKAAVAAGQTALLAPAYKLGEVAQQAELQSSPIRVEQLQHALFSVDSLYSALAAVPFAILGHGLEGLPQAAGNAGRRAASKLFPKAARALGIEPEEAGAIALEKGILKDQTKIDDLRRTAGEAMGEAARSAQIDETFRAHASEHIKQMVDAGEPVAIPMKARRFLYRQRAVLKLQDLDGEGVDNMVRNIADKAKEFRAGTPAREYLQSAAHDLRGFFADHLDIMDPEAGAQYRAALADYHTYARMTPEAVSGAAKQFTNRDALLTAAGVIAPKVAGAALPGAGVFTVGLEAGLVAAGKSPVSGKNYATFLDQFQRNPPYANFLRNSGKAVQSLLNPATVASTVTKLTADEVDQRYGEITGMLRQCTLDPEGTARKIRARLDFLAPHEADALTAKCVNALHESTAEIPSAASPATAFGIQTSVPTPTKRQFLEKCESKFDPYKAIASGRADLIAEAEKHCPETMHYVRGRVLDEMSKRKDIPYETRRRVSALLGSPGTPLQAPVLGAQLQQTIQTHRQANTQSGQIESSRQIRATQKQDAASLTRAQSLLEAGP